MLGIILIASCFLRVCLGSPVNGYSLGTLNGGRGQEYSNGYRSGSFVAMKNSQDYPDHTDSHRYSVLSSGSSYSSTPGNSYSTDSGYSDSSIVGGQGSQYGGQSNLESDTSGGSQSSSTSYSSDPSADTSELVGASYSTSGSSTGGLSSYSTNGVTGNHVESGFVGYSDASKGGGSASNFASGLSGNERGEYSSSNPSSSYLSYNVGGPKVAAYTTISGGHGNHGHGLNSYSSNPNVIFPSNGHRGSSVSALSSSYPTEMNHPSMSSNPNFSSASSLNNYLASMHGNSPSNYIQHSRDTHRPTSGHHHLFASASNPNSAYASRGPNSGYFSAPYSRGNSGSGGGKIIIVKESSGAHHPGHVFPGEQHSYNGGMFASTNGAFKIRNIGSGTSHGPPSFTSNYSPMAGYNGLSSSHSNNNHAGSFFSFL